MSKITISADSCVDIGLEAIKKHDINIVPFGIAIGENLILDRCDVDPEVIYKAVEKDNIIPKTNAIPADTYREVFEEATKDGGSIIHINISSKLSVSCDAAKKAAEGMERVYIVDSLSLSGGVGFLAVKAKEMVDAGKSAEETHKACEELVKKLDLSFIVMDLKYLHRGGRVSGIKLLGANLLKIRPTLVMDEAGRMVPGRKFKGEWSGAVREYLAYRLDNAKNACKEYVHVVHTVIDEAVRDELIQGLKDFGFKKVTCSVAGTTVTTHGGKNLLGFVYANK